MPGMFQFGPFPMKQPALFLRAAAVSAVLTLAACTATGPVVPQQQPTPAPVTPPSPPPQVNTPDQDALRSLVALHDRLYRVAGPLLVNNASLCKKSARNLLGFTAKTKYSYSGEYVDAAQKVFGLDDRLQVMGVLANSGAASSGIQRGDKLVTIDDKPMPQGQNAERQAATLLAPLVQRRNSIRLGISRAGGDTTIDVPLTPACAFGVELGNTDIVNAYADGIRIMATRGMMNFAQSDEELAYVLAKEMAHNVLGHARRMKMNATIGGVIENLVRIRPDMSTLTGLSGIKPYPQDMDAAADTLSLYMVARAGFTVDSAKSFWLRLAAQYPAATVPNGYNALHPATANRIAAIDKTVLDIKEKQAARKPIEP